MDNDAFAKCLKGNEFSLSISFILTHTEEGLYAIVEALGRNFPKGSRAHLFGVKHQALNEIPKMGFVASSDSMAWDFGSRVKAHKAGVSNSMERRTKEMSEWMSAAMARISASARLPSSFLYN